MERYGTKPATHKHRSAIDPTAYAVEKPRSMGDPLSESFSTIEKAYLASMTKEELELLEGEDTSGSSEEEDTSGSGSGSLVSLLFLLGGAALALSAVSVGKVPSSVGKKVPLEDEENPGSEERSRTSRM